jgi:hypothetical protein
MRIALLATAVVQLAALLLSLRLPGKRPPLPAGPPATRSTTVKA